jgi:hypothetical protein
MTNRCLVSAMKLSWLVAALLGALVARGDPDTGPAEVASVKSMTGIWLLDLDKNKPVRIGQVLHERNVITFGGGNLSLGANPTIVVTDLGGGPLDGRSCDSWEHCSPIPLVIPTIKSIPGLRNVSAVYVRVMNALFAHQDAAISTISKGIACGSVTDDIAWPESARLNLSRVLDTTKIPGGGDAALHFLAYPPSTLKIDLTARNGWAESIPVGLYTMTCNKEKEVYWVLVLPADRARDSAARLDEFRRTFQGDVADAQRLTRGYLISIAPGQPN